MARLILSGLEQLALADWQLLDKLVEAGFDLDRKVWRGSFWDRDALLFLQDEKVSVEAVGNVPDMRTIKVDLDMSKFKESLYG